MMSGRDRLRFVKREDRRKTFGRNRKDCRHTSKEEVPGLDRAPFASCKKDLKEEVLMPRANHEQVSQRSRKQGRRTLSLLLLGFVFGRTILGAVLTLLLFHVFVVDTDSLRDLGTQSIVVSR